MWLHVLPYSFQCFDFKESWFEYINCVQQSFAIQLSLALNFIRHIFMHGKKRRTNEWRRRSSSREKKHTLSSSLPILWLWTLQFIAIEMEMCMRSKIKSQNGWKNEISACLRGFVNIKWHALNSNQRYLVVNYMYIVRMPLQKSYIGFFIFFVYVFFSLFCFYSC